MHRGYVNVCSLYYHFWFKVNSNEILLISRHKFAYKDRHLLVVSVNQVLAIKLVLQDHKDSPADRAHKDPQGHQDRLDQQAQLDSVDYGV